MSIRSLCVSSLRLMSGARSLFVALCVVMASAGRVAADVFLEPVLKGSSPYLAAIVTLLIACFCAANQASAAVVNAVDLQPFLSNIIDLAIYVTGPPLAVLIVGLCKRLYDWVGVKRSAARDVAIRDTVDQVLGYATSFARAKVGAVGPIPVNMRSAAVAHAAEYAMQGAAATFKKLGIADKASKRLSDMIEARLDVAGASVLGSTAAT